MTNLSGNTFIPADLAGLPDTALLVLTTINSFLHGIRDPDECRNRGKPIRKLWYSPREITTRLLIRHAISANPSDPKSVSLSVYYGICLLSVVPCRKDPSGASEMVTQLLFGECYEIHERADGWLRINTQPDNYPCWLSEKQHAPISQRSFNEQIQRKPLYANDLVQVVHDKIRKTSFPVTIGAALPGYREHQLVFDDYLFGYDGAVTNGKKQSGADIVSTSFVFLNAPYLWGGRSPFGIDCSGFTQLVFRLNGYQIPRDSQQQATIGQPLSFVEEAQPGDLAFFDNAEGRITHVGILIGNGQIIHSSGKVKIDRMDHYGIHSSEHKKYTHNLRVIRRIV
jgi:gamma-D-glutamyl-L-lysine dipeptidyl-peptidase